MSPRLIEQSNHILFHIWDYLHVTELMRTIAPTHSRFAIHLYSRTEDDPGPMALTQITHRQYNYLAQRTVLTLQNLKSIATDHHTAKAIDKTLQRMPNLTHLHLYLDPTCCTSYDRKRYILECLFFWITARCPRWRHIHFTGHSYVVNCLWWGIFISLQSLLRSPLSFNAYLSIVSHDRHIMSDVPEGILFMATDYEWVIPPYTPVAGVVSTMLNLSTPCREVFCAQKIRLSDFDISPRGANERVTYVHRLVVEPIQQQDPYPRTARIETHVWLALHLDNHPIVIESRFTHVEAAERRQQFKLLVYQLFDHNTGCYGAMKRLRISKQIDDALIAHGVDSLQILLQTYRPDLQFDYVSDSVKEKRMI